MEYIGTNKVKLRTWSSWDAQVTIGKRGETIILIACCIAEGNSMMYWVFKGKRNKNKFGDGMSPVSYRIMNKTSTYVTVVVFTDGLNNYFISRSESGILLFILILTSPIVQTLTLSTSIQKWCPTAVSQNALFAASSPSFLQAIKDTLAKNCEQMAAQKARSKNNTPSIT